MVQPLRLIPVALVAHQARPVALMGSSAAPSVTSLVSLPPASVFAAGPEVAHYWVARDGGAASNYLGFRLVLGTDYVWCTHGGAGHDPGLEDAELDGLTGHVVALGAGNLDADDVATAIAEVIDALDGWSCTADGDTLEIDGPEAVTTGTEWDDATPGAMVGTRAIVAAGPPIEGGINDVICQHLPSPGLARPVIAVDILIGSTADNTDRWRLGLWTAQGGTGTPLGETLLVDLGRLAQASVVADRWARLYVPPGTSVLANQAMWLSITGNVNTTPVAGRLTGDALNGDWTDQALRVADTGAAVPMPANPATSLPATFTATTSSGSPFVCAARLVVAGTVGDASWHSTSDPAAFGTHVEPGTLGSYIDLDSRLFMVAPSPPFLGMRLVDAGWIVGSARGTQPRLGVFTGGVATEPVDPDGATVLADGGQLTGSSTGAWERRSLGDVAWSASTATAWAAECNNATSGTTIEFAQDPSQANANPPETPMDWLPVGTGGPYGSEYEEFGADNDPATPFVSPYVAPASPARPTNVPGADLRFRIPGATIAS